MLGHTGIERRMRLLARTCAQKPFHDVEPFVAAPSTETVIEACIEGNRSLDWEEISELRQAKSFICFFKSKI